ncbi:mitomycin resistance protein [candidate division GN15 bacterium]|nr:mitomycin resistance protein [candidate division GN15 bacterium]
MSPRSTDAPPSHDTRQLRDLVSVGPKTVEDFRALGIERVAQLVGQDADRLLSKLQQVTGRKHDVCCIDVFRAAIAQAEDPDLEPARCRWWYWSAIRNG